MVYSVLMCRSFTLLFLSIIISTKLMECASTENEHWIYSDCKKGRVYVVYNSVLTYVWIWNYLRVCVSVYIDVRRQKTMQLNEQNKTKKKRISERERKTVTRDNIVRTGWIVYCCACVVGATHIHTVTLSLSLPLCVYVYVYFVGRSFSNKTI